MACGSFIYVLLLQCSYLWGQVYDNVLFLFVSGLWTSLYVGTWS
jgi:hypothetical protein